jgi:AMP-polyphosphate phosphotransferase
LVPWHVIPANNKPYARLAVFTILIHHLGGGLSLEPRQSDPQVAEVAAKLFKSS